MSTPEPTAQGDEPATSYSAADEGPLAHAGALLIFDGPLERGDLLRAVARAVRAHPELRSRPTRLPLAADLLAWTPERDFRLARQVRAIDAGDAPGAIHAASTLWSQPLPVDRPPWQVHLLTGPDDTGTVVVVRGHAALAREAGGAALAETLLAAHEPARTPTDPAREDEVPRSTALLPALLGATLTLAERGARRSSRLAAEVRGLLRPGAALARTREIGRALESAGTLLSSPAPETPWNRALGPERALAWLSFRLDVLRGLATRTGHDWRDVWLTVLADALGRLLRARGRDTTGLALLAYVPTSVQAPGDAAVTPLLVALPVAEMSFTARAAAVERSRRDPVAASRGAGLAQLVALTERLPEPLKSLLGSLCHQAANVVSAAHAASSEPIVVAGRTARLVVPLAGLPWHVGLSLDALLLGDQLVVGVTTDTASLPSAEAVTRALDEAYAELRREAGASPLGPHGSA